MNSKIKNIIILVVVAVALVLIYIFFIKKEPTEPLLTSSSMDPLVSDGTIPGGETPEISGDFISMLLNVKGIRLEDAILKDPAFVSLFDSTIILVQLGDEGRPNPFAPIGSESSSVPTNPTLALPTNPINPTSPISPTIQPPDSLPPVE